MQHFYCVCLVAFLSPTVEKHFRRGIQSPQRWRQKFLVSPLSGLLVNQLFHHVALLRSAASQHDYEENIKTYIYICMHDIRPVWCLLFPVCGLFFRCEKNSRKMHFGILSATIWVFYVFAKLGTLKLLANVGGKPVWRRAYIYIYTPESHKCLKHNFWTFFNDNKGPPRQKFNSYRLCCWGGGFCWVSGYLQISFLPDFYGHVSAPVWRLRLRVQGWGLTKGMWWCQSDIIKTFLLAPTPERQEACRRRMRTWMDR